MYNARLATYDASLATYDAKLATKKFPVFRKLYNGIPQTFLPEAANFFSWSREIFSRG